MDCLVHLVPVYQLSMGSMQLLAYGLCIMVWLRRKYTMMSKLFWTVSVAFEEQNEQECSDAGFPMSVCKRIPEPEEQERGILWRRMGPVLWCEAVQASQNPSCSLATTKRKTCLPFTWDGRVSLMITAQKGTLALVCLWPWWTSGSFQGEDDGAWIFLLDSWWQCLQLQPWQCWHNTSTGMYLNKQNGMDVSDLFSWCQKARRAQIWFEVYLMLHFKKAQIWFHTASTKLQSQVPSHRCWFCFIQNVSFLFTTLRQSSVKAIVDLIQKLDSYPPHSTKGSPISAELDNWTFLLQSCAVNQTCPWRYINWFRWKATAWHTRTSTRSQMVTMSPIVSPEQKLHSGCQACVGNCTL